MRCKECLIYVVQNNYQQHTETIVHKIAAVYFSNDKVQINGTQSEDRILSSRIFSPTHNSINNFFLEVESNVLDLVDRVIKLQNNKLVNITIQMLALYNWNKSIPKTNQSTNLGKVESFMIKNEVNKNNNIINIHICIITFLFILLFRKIPTVLLSQLDLIRINNTILN